MAHSWNIYSSYVPTKSRTKWKCVGMRMVAMAKDLNAVRLQEAHILMHISVEIHTNLWHCMSLYALMRNISKRTSTSTQHIHRNTFNSNATNNNHNSWLWQMSCGIMCVYPFAHHPSQARTHAHSRVFNCFRDDECTRVSLCLYVACTHPTFYISFTLY